MPPFRLRTDLQRVRLDGYALPLGLEPSDERPPVQGYTVSINRSEEDDTETCGFHVVVSHERIPPILHDALGLLPEQVFPIFEIDSLDAYRTVDVYIGQQDDPVDRAEFLDAWREFEPVLLEDGAIAAGANAEDPFIEVFLDQWKGLAIHVPLDRRGEVERLLAAHGLREVKDTWPAPPAAGGDVLVRPVLDIADPEHMSLEDLVIELRRRWRLELDIDPERNLDEGGRELGLTLWYCELLAHPRHSENGRDGLMQLWASASSLSQLESLIGEAMDNNDEWSVSECLSVVRVAYDDRPEMLNSLKPRRTQPEVHYATVSVNDSGESESDGSSHA